MRMAQDEVRTESSGLPQPASGGLSRISLLRVSLKKTVMAFVNVRNGIGMKESLTN